MRLYLLQFANRQEAKFDQFVNLFFEVKDTANDDAKVFGGINKHDIYAYVVQRKRSNAFAHESNIG